MPTTIDSAGITFNDATSFTSATLAANSVGATQIVNGSVIASKLGTTEQKQICKAWVNFNGTTSPGTIRSSYNVSSVTKNGTGDYIVNFATPMTDANYSVNVTGTTGATNATSGLYGTLSDNITPRTSSLFRVNTLNNSSAVTDCAFVSISVFGN
jgi:hypothetical protein